MNEDHAYGGVAVVILLLLIWPFMLVYWFVTLPARVFERLRDGNRL